jgi:hypothetical protein
MVAAATRTLTWICSSVFPNRSNPARGALSSTGLSFKRFSHPIAFSELSNSPPLTRSCQDGNDEISLDSAPYAGPAIASCDESRIHSDAERGDLDAAEKNGMSSHLLCGLEFALFEGDTLRVLGTFSDQKPHA